MFARSGIAAIRVLAVALVLGACSSSAVDTQARMAGGLSAAPASTAGPAAAPAFDASGAGSNESSTKAAPAPDETLIVKTGTLVLDVKNLDAALAKAQAAVAAAGGYVSGSDRSGQGDQQTATVTYRIPAASWDAALGGVRAVAANVEKEQTSAVEVTGQVLDLGARITNLRATESALQAIMARATKIADVLAVQQQLTDVQGQIEQLTTQQQHLQQQAALGTLTATFLVPVVAVTAATSGWDPGRQVDDATAQLIGLGQGLATAGIWLAIVGLPIVLVLLLIAVPLAWVARRARARAGRRPPEAPLWGPDAASGTQPGA